MEELVGQILTNGYCVVPQVYDPGQIDRALQLVRDLDCHRQECDTADVPYLAQNARIIWNLHYKHPFFIELILGSQQIELLLVQLLNDAWYRAIPPDQPNFILRSLNARSSIDPLPLHIDSFFPYSGDLVISMQCAVLLEDMNSCNGATIVVPGSHLSGEYVQQTALDDAIPIEACAGDVVLWDSRLWHGALANHTAGTRWTVTASFTRWWIKQAFNIPRNLPPEIYRGLTDSQKSILGFCSIPFDDESQGIDMRRGYEALPPRVSDNPTDLEVRRR